MIQTPRLQLRPLTPDDVEAFHQIWGDSDVIWWGAHESVEQTRQFLAHVLTRVQGHDAHGWFAMLPHRDGRIIGDVVLQPAPWHTDVAEIGWHVAKAGQGQGYATEAAVALVEHARTNGITHLEAIIVPDNEPSRRVAQKLGMSINGTQMHGGLLHDLWVLDVD